jgi:hypothetical protein
VNEAHTAGVLPDNQVISSNTCKDCNRLNYPKFELARIVFVKKISGASSFIQIKSGEYLGTNTFFEEIFRNSKKS